VSRPPRRLISFWRIGVLRTPVGKIVGSIPELKLADERPLLGKPFTP
jgi:hypothetical protein